MGIASASETAARPLARAIRRWLVLAVALIALVSILPSVGSRPFGRQSVLRAPGRAAGGRRVRPGVGATVREDRASDIAPASGTAARPSRRGAFHYLRRALYWLAVAAASVALGAVLASVGARMFGYSPHIMYGGSMGSAAPLGSIAFIEDVPAESLKVDDVIVFRPPAEGEAREPLMHRIVSIEEVDGQRVVKTKGDANDSVDPWELGISGEGGRLVFVVPYVGYLLWFLQTRVAWAALILPLAAYLGFVALRRIWAPAGGRDAPRIRAP